MKKQSYQRILAVLISLMILLTAGMAIVGAGLLQTRFAGHSAGSDGYRGFG